MNKRFKRIYIEITNVCNLSCSFCPKTTRKPEFMQKKLFAHILNEVKPYSNYLYFHVMGEPLLHPQIETFLDLCGEYGFYANITTNGTLIRQTEDKIIHKKALRLINFSLHSQEERHNTAPEYLDDIFKFAQLAEKENPNLIISLRLWNYSDIPSLFNKKIISEIKNFFKYPEEIKKIPQTGNGLKVRRNLYLSQAERFVWPDSKREEISSGGFCLGLRDQIAILVDGTVVPCCLDSEGSINLGNIGEQHLQEIIESDRTQFILKGFSKRRLVEDLCRKCSFRNRFN